MWVWRALRSVAIFCLLSSFMACSGTGTIPSDGSGTVPAAPAPPLEIPQFLRFPADIGVDVSGLGETGSSSTLLAQATATDIRRAAEAGPAAIQFSNQILSLVLFPVSLAEIPVDPSVTSFKQTITIPDDETPFDATFTFDFRPFDLDGDGNNEACSGSTCPVTGTSTCPSEAPANELQNICFRIWVNDKRFMAGVFDRMPTEGNIGSAEFSNVTFAELGDDSFEFHVFYDHSNSNDRSTELFAGIKANESGKLSLLDHQLVGEQIVDGDKKKSIKISTTIIEGSIPGAEGPNMQQYIAEFVDGIDLIGLHYIRDGIVFMIADDSPSEDITPAVCAQASTGIETSLASCQDLDIDVTGEPFLDFASEADIGLPADFPETPPL